ncbi:MAG: hypothetical protein LBD41_03145 [Clostridiales Family XIII bacterium]|jgi:hypothetical protein|nr:hypothetical protein [Clostridiales Family XIII bacterium]
MSHFWGNIEGNNGYQAYHDNVIILKDPLDETQWYYWSPESGGKYSYEDIQREYNKWILSSSKLREEFESDDDAIYDFQIKFFD